MRNYFIVAILSLTFSLNLSASAMMDTTIIEILDDTLDQIYYYQDSFPEPTRLVYPNLTTVSGIVYFQENDNLISVDMPKLHYTGDYIGVSSNEKLYAFRAPVLDTVYDHIFIYENDTLVEFDLCALGHILPRDEYQIPYYALADNSDILDNTDVCFSEGPPENLSLSDSSIVENKMPLHTIGILSADGNYAENYFTYYLSEDSWDYDDFIVVGDTLKANVTFDYEIKNEYQIRVGVFNQLGEQVEKEFMIEIIDAIDANIEIVEILDDTLSSLYYHQENFTVPTSLVFPNLTTVLGSAYFHQNVNLVSVEMPQLNKTGDYFYFSGNSVLESVQAPLLDTVFSYISVNGNTALVDLDICNLTHILPIDEWADIPYYNISGNTSGVDQTPFCFSLEGPSNLDLTGLSIVENSDPETTIGTFSSDGVYPINTMTYYLTEDGVDNDFFQIEGDLLKSNATFDYEVKNQYEISIGVYNQLGEIAESNFTISIEDMVNEGLQIVEILEDTLTTLYYHQENFTQPTKLVFPNLTTVLEYAYFHQNVNLVSIDLPKLNYVGDYTYINGNTVLDTVSCPVIDTIHNYLYVANNVLLRELDVCNLSHILSTDMDEDAYYYIENNPILDFSSTCLEDTELGFTEFDTLIQSSSIMVGNFEANTLDPVAYYLLVDGIEQTEDENFFIEDNAIFLKKDLSEYTDALYYLDIVALRMDNEVNTTLNEKIELSIQFEVADKDVTSGVDGIDIQNVIEVAPNPTSDNVNLKVSKNDRLSIYDARGKLQGISDLKAGNNLIDLSSYESGLYFFNTDLGSKFTVIKI